MQVALPTLVSVRALAAATSRPLAPQATSRLVIGQFVVQHLGPVVVQPPKIFQLHKG